MHFFLVFVFPFFCGSGWRRRWRRRRRGLCQASCQQLHTTASSFLQTTGCVSGFRESEGFRTGATSAVFWPFGRQRWRWWRRWRASAQPRRHLSGQNDGGVAATTGRTAGSSGSVFFFFFPSSAQTGSVGVKRRCRRNLAPSSRLRGELQVPERTTFRLSRQ